MATKSAHTQSTVTPTSDAALAARIGNLGIPVGILAAFYVTFDLFNDTILFQSSTILWGVVFLLVAGFTYGKVGAKLLGYVLVINGLWGFLPAVYLALNQPIQ